jgi:phosphodiesterase/alkaline phosphatase D-like protein
MSVDFAWYGATTNTIRLAVRCTAAGDCTLRWAGGSVVRTVDPSAHDGIVYYEIAGLPAGTDYPATVEQDGELYELPLLLRTLPTDKLKVVHVSCQAVQRTTGPRYGNILKMRPDLLIHSGDLSYKDTDYYSSLNGENVTAGAGGITRANYLAWERAARRHISFKRLTAVTPFYFMWDDHELTDAWCFSINLCNRRFIDGTPGAVQLAANDADIIAIYNICKGVMDDYAWTNPKNTDAGIDAGALYHRVRVGSLCEIYVPDLMSYKDISYALSGPATEVRPIYAPSNPLKTMMGVAQKSWYKSAKMQAQADGVAHKITISSKQTYDHGPGALNNDDTWTGYTAERDELLAHEYANITGYCWQSGDSHQLAVYYNDTYKHICINACSIGSGEHQEGTGYNANVLYKQWGYAGQPEDYVTARHCFGWIEITPEKQVHTVYDADTLDVMYGPINVLAGSKGPEYIKPRIG